MGYKSRGPEGMLIQTQSIILPPRRHKKTRFSGLILPTALLQPQEGEATLGIVHLSCCEGRSYSGHIQLTPDVAVNAIHCNGRHPSIPEDG